MKLIFFSPKILFFTIGFAFSVSLCAQDTIPQLSELEAMYEMEDYETCLSELEKILATEPSSEALRLQADCYHKLGELNTALPAYDQAIEKESENPISLLHRGICHYGLDNLKAAKKDLEMCLVLDPDNAMAYYYLGEIAYEKFEQEEAIEKLDIAIDLDPNYMEAYYLRAAASSEIGNPRQAIKDYEKAMELKPEYKRSMMNLAVVHMDRGDFEIALDLLKQLSLEVIDFKSEVFYYTAEAKLSLNDKVGACKALSEAARLGDEEAEKAFKSICENGGDKLPERKKARASF